MIDQYKCQQCGDVIDVGELMCSECGTGTFERVSWDSKCVELSKTVDALRAELASRDEMIERLKEDAEILCDILPFCGRCSCGIKTPRANEGVGTSDILTDEQLNEAIFKAKGWMKLEFPAFPKWQRPIRDGEVDEFGKGVTGWYELVPDYTHDWRLAGELLEEMGNAITDGWEFSSEHSDMDGLELLKWRVWMIRFTDDPADFRSVCGEADTPQRAICEAWLAWKELK